jgi:hypothetical protein
MRKGLFLSALLASIFVSGAALADRDNDESNDSKKYSRGNAIKEQVLEKMRENKMKTVRENKASRQTNKALDRRITKSRPHGDVYGDQATRSTTKAAPVTASGRNLSATGAVNTPREIKQMLSRINPMYGAYRTSQAAEGTDSYGGESMTKTKTQNGQQRNLSATGAVNTPAEIRAMLRMINPMHGAYRTSQAAEGTDSYGGSEPFATGAVSKGAVSNTAKSSKVRERVERVVKKAEPAVEKNLDRAATK